jgi:arylsulfatase A-like enzyme
VGFGVVSEIATGFPGYDSIIPIENGTIGTILRDNGYATSWFGKNHNTPFFQAAQAGPFDQWPNGMGFEYFYGFMGGDASQWQPNLFRNTTPIFPFEGKGLEPDHGDGRRGDPVHAELEGAGTGQALPRLLRARRHARAASSDAGVDRQDQRDEALRRGLGTSCARRSSPTRSGWASCRPTLSSRPGRRTGICPSGTRSAVKRRSSFIKQADVLPPTLAYTDNEIGRVIQAVEDMGSSTTR